MAIAVGLAALAGAYPLAKNGMRATYFSTIDWTGDSVTRIDSIPSLEGLRLALNPIPRGGFSTQWIGTLVVDRAGLYQLRITTNGRCLASLDNRLHVDSRVRGVPEVLLEAGVYTLSVSCSTTAQPSGVAVWWDRAGTDRPQRLTRDVLFPYRVTLSEYRRLAWMAHLQPALTAFAAVGTVLLVLLWAHARGVIAWTIVLVMSTAIAAVHFDWAPWLRGPEEWRWGYWDHSFDRSPFLALAFGLSVLTVTSLTGSRHAERAPRTAAIVLLAAGLIGGFGFQLALVDTDPGGWRRFVVERVSDELGYLRSAVQSSHLPLSQLIRTYPTMMPTLSFRAATHPPGGTLMYRTLMWAAMHWGRATPLPTVALEGGLIWAASATLTALPVALAVWSITGNALRAAGVGLLWLSCPGPIFFVPWLDQLDTLLVACSFALLIFAQSVLRWSAVWAALSGVIAGVALFFSYGTLPMLGTALLMAGYRSDSAAGRRAYVLAIVYWSGGLLTALFAPVILGYPVVSTALAALHAHRRVTLTRHEATWLFYNPLEFVMMFGGASVVMMIATLIRRPWRATTWRLTTCALFALLLTDLSGTARGEVGRLWMPFMPLLFAAAWSAPAWSGEERASSGLASRDAVALGAMMMLYCAVLRLHWVVW